MKNHVDFLSMLTLALVFCAADLNSQQPFFKKTYDATAIANRKVCVATGFVIPADTTGFEAGSVAPAGVKYAETDATDEVSIAVSASQGLPKEDIAGETTVSGERMEPSHCRNPPLEIYYDIALCPGEPYHYGGVDYYAPGEFVVVLLGPLGCDTIIHYGLLAYPQVTLYDTIPLCPGEAIVINGQSYTQPGTVFVNLPAQMGCDTVLRYTLVSKTPAPSTVSIQCPPDISFLVDAGNVPLEVLYDLPTATTDCLCPGLTFIRTAGLTSGSAFLNGTTMVCYTAEDLCGSTASCCFEVGIEEKQPCDVKVIGCMRYELLSITTDVEHHLTYRIRVVNNCAGKLLYTAIQLPDGVIAHTPEHLSVFTAESGRQYDVRNPNAMPFYSIRFRSSVGSIYGGQSEIFQYTLPAQVAPAYLNIASRLTTQAYYETHLNTYDCPTGTTPTVNRASVAVIVAQPPSLLFPNPTTDGALWVDRGSRGVGKVEWQIFDVGGTLLTRRAQVASGSLFRIELPQTIPNGLYYLEIMEGDGHKERQPFVVQRR
jgi:hypothetical protein